MENKKMLLIFLFVLIFTLGYVFVGICLAETPTDVQGGEPSGWAPPSPQPWTTQVFVTPVESTESNPAVASLQAQGQETLSAVQVEINNPQEKMIGSFRLTQPVWVSE